MGKLVFGDVSVSDRLFGLVIFVLVNWVVIGVICDVVVGFLWCIREYIIFCGVSDFLLWNVMFWWSVIC